MGRVWTRGGSSLHLTRATISHAINIRGLALATIAAAGFLATSRISPLFDGSYDTTAGAASGSISLSIGAPKAAAGSGQLSDWAASLPILTASRLKPGDTVTGKVTITNGHSPAAVYLSETSVTSSGPAGAANLAKTAQSDRLTVVDDTTGIIYYSNSPFDSFNNLQPLAICDIVPGSPPRSCPGWSGREAHTFTFAVAYPHSSGNSFQATTASAAFDWA